MTTRALVPVKRLADAKSRLGNELTRVERADLVLGMLDHVLDVLLSVPELESVTVVTGDPAVSRSALAAGAGVVPERAQGLNPALDAARRELSSDACLVVFGDLPYLQPSEVRELMELGDSSCCVAAPDKAGVGTNLLLLRPPTALPLCFGPGSYQLYREAAARVELPFGTYRSRGTEFDVDTPDDLRLYYASRGNAGLTAGVLTGCQAAR